MAGSAVIGALRVVLGADTAAFETGLKRAQGQASSFFSSVTKIAAGIGLERAVANMVSGYIEAFKAGIEHADKMAKAAQKIGLSVEEFTKLKLAADLSDVSVESLSAGLGKLSKAMVEVARGGGDQAGLAFRQLGISVREADGSMKSTTTVLSEVAGKFGTMTDGANKTALAMAIFGKGGKDLIPMLNEGKEGIEGWAKVAERMGLVISEKTAAQSQKFNDNLKLINLSTQGVVNRIMEGMLPALVKLSEKFVQSAKDGTGLLTWADSFNASIKSIVMNSAPVLQFFQEMSTISEAFGEMRSALRGGTSDAADASKKFADVFSGAFDRIRNARDEAKKIFDEPLQLRVTKEFDPASANLAKAIEDLSFKTRVLRGDFEGLAPGFAEAARGLGLFGVSAQDAWVKTETINPSLTKLNQGLLEFQRAQIKQDVLTPWEAYEQQIRKIEVAFADMEKKPPEYARAMELAAARVGLTWGQMGSSVLGSMATIADAFGKENRQMAIAAKAFAIAQAILNAYLASSKAFATLPPPASYVTAAAALATGLATVMQIKSQPLPAMKFGGSFTVPGGIGGGDKRLFQAMLEPGEMVDITPSNQQSSGRGGGGGVREIWIHGLTSPKQIFNQKGVREFAEMLNEAIGDGVRLRFT